jgi:membrane protease YdiL (CAAX protease family)
MESDRLDISAGPQPRRATALWWFAAALVPLIASQLMRLHQHDAASWIAWDYAGRIAALAVLCLHPAVRAMAFCRDRRQIPLVEIAIWIVGISSLRFYCKGAIRFVTLAFPATLLGHYPQVTGWLKPFDLVVGLALVAFSEEIIFRRYLRAALQPYLGDGVLAIIAAAVLFGAYHWWTGLGTVLFATLVGILLMLMYRRSGALWPVVLAHYLVDFIAFA